VHLLHIALPLPLDATLVRLLFKLCCCGYALISQQGGTARPTRILRHLITGMFFFLALHESALVMKWMLAQVYWFVPSLSFATV
jgi:hypothetical protein